jgi:diguanylate cyclase (GGDEF)-like protein
LNTPPEERFDRYTRFARQLLDAPIAYVSIVGEDIQWIKSAEGIPTGPTERALSFCTHAIIEKQIMVVEDALEDERFSANPFVISDPFIRFYTGVKLNIDEGVCIGTLCVCDTKPRYPSEDALARLRELASLLEDEFRVHARATTDPLTGLSNRQGLKTIGEYVLALCDRLEKASTLMYIKLQGLREINAQYGREMGDRILKDLGGMLLNEFRHSDVVARVEGEVFFILLTGTGAKDLTKPVKNFDHAIKEENMNLPFELTYQLGAVEFDKETHTDMTGLLEEADRAVEEDSGAPEGSQ